MKRVSALAAASLIFVCSCAEGEPETEEQSVAANAPGSGNSRPIRALRDPASCERDGDGQIECLKQSFGLTECGEAAVLGSMFRDNDASKAYSHRTAFGLGNSCVEDLRDGATSLGFRENDRGELVGRLREGYSETLIFGLQVSTDGSVVEWEREKQ